MESTISNNRVAVVTGGNKGIGLEICRQLASNGVKVILAARDETRGMEAVEKLKKDSVGLSDVIFHQLDVTERSSIASLADFIQTHFGKLDILVNNAAIVGQNVDYEVLMASKPADFGQDLKDDGDIPDWMKKSTQETYEMAEECLKTNYYGTKHVIEALIPLLRSSNSGTIVNVSSTLGQLRFISNEKIKQVLSHVDGTADQLDELVKWFLKDFKEGLLESNGWPTAAAAYKVSKALVNAYTRVLAKQYHPNLRINCVSPGFTKTDMNWNSGILTVEEGAEGPVKLALMAHGSPSGLFFDRTKVSTFE